MSIVDGISIVATSLKDMWFPNVRGMFMPNFDLGSTFVAEILHFLLLRMRARAQSQKIGLFVDKHAKWRHFVIGKVAYNRLVSL